MKSELLLAFNQLCAERNLPRETVMEAIRAAIVSAYRRDTGVPSHQNITAQIDLETGKVRILTERLVVAKVSDPQTEILLEEARRINPRVQPGETVMVDTTPANFGRIAAQAARQRIMQCIREAEREVRYAHFAEQEGELVHGVIQSVSPQQVILHLERTEAILPRKEMIPGERYVLHDRIRVYVLEVKKTPRGPQIIVSRNHWKLLKRLLELEVPEIASGAVEIKAIAREAGVRSKVAVTARQPGIDPVGACIGMSGMRIQSILRELGNEKVDIIEWSPDPVIFVAKALGPAKVLSVVLDEDAPDPIAYVVVPDDQLSLAIGKAGLNARLATKLTGWRIDVQSATEASQWALKQVNENPEIMSTMELSTVLVSQVQAALTRHEQERMPYNAEELLAMRQLIEKVRGYQLALKQGQRDRRKAKVRKSAAEEERQAREAAIREARARIPIHAYQISLEDLGLSERTRKHLERHKLTNAGLLMEQLAEGEEGLLKLEGIGARVLAEIREALNRISPAPAPKEIRAPVAVPEAEPTVAPPPVIEETPPVVVSEEARVVAAEMPAEVVPVEPKVLPEEVVSAATDFVPATETPILLEHPEAVAPAAPAITEIPTDAVTLAEEALVKAPVSSGETTMLSAEPPILAPETISEIEEWEEDEEEEEEIQKLGRKVHKRHKKPRREFIYDEELGRTIAIRKHRRRGEDWEDF